MPAPRHDVDTSGPRRPGAALALLAFASLITSLDYNIVYVALPDIGRGVGFSAQTLQWVVSAYAVAFGAFLLLGGRMSDLLGRRRMFVLGLALFAVASSAGGLAREPGALIAARAGQGLGGALLFPATLSLVNTTFAEGRERNHALSVWAATGSGGLILGSLLGGVLTRALGWEAVFFVNVPLAGGAALLTFVILPADPARVSGRRFDVFGALTATLGSTLLVFTLVQGPESGWTSPLVAAGGVLGVGLLVVFLVAEGRHPDALMPLRLLRDRSLGTGMAVTFLFMATLGTLPYFLTVYFQGVHGYSALRTGFAYLVPMGGGLIGSLLGGRLATRFGVRSTLPASLAVSAVGLVVVGLGISANGSYLDLAPGLLVFGIGQGVVYTTMFAAAATGVRPHEQGVASGMASTGQQVGGAMGLAVLVAVANSGTDGRTGEALRTATADGLRTAVFGAAAGAVLAVLVALNFRRVRGSAVDAGGVDEVPRAERARPGIG
ncbi:MFS transporter (plasmid) [Embleya sp. NBC_00888]|uniref:MFS transporter n=1 Tax=Embleya sp. NBC_00888 TaxID=2975960 RepID=UPI002F912490|nr:MFS transporter [Embleya sp. NBC_00888]